MSVKRLSKRGYADAAARAALIFPATSPFKIGINDVTQERKLMKSSTCPPEPVNLIGILNRLSQLAPVRSLKLITQSKNENVWE
jgi:hypothetical protein